LLTATNRNLDRLVEAGQFRKDLLFRIRSITLEVPLLRDHLDDLVEIAIYHTARICKRSRLNPKKLSPDFIEALLSYSWPGNVRELVNAIERAIAAALSAPTLFRSHLPSAIRVKLAQNKTKGAAPDENQKSIVSAFPFPRLKDLRESTYAQVEKDYLLTLLKSTGGDIEQTCRIADLGRTRLYELLRKYKITI
jgi:two-component system NtrC family response regulator